MSFGHLEVGLGDPAVGYAGLAHLIGSKLVEESLSLDNWALFSQGL